MKVYLLLMLVLLLGLVMGCGKQALICFRYPLGKMALI